jgi:hypothetical protein
LQPIKLEYGMQGSMILTSSTASFNFAQIHRFFLQTQSLLRKAFLFVGHNYDNTNMNIYKKPCLRYRNLTKMTCVAYLTAKH